MHLAGISKLRIIWGIAYAPASQFPEHAQHVAHSPRGKHDPRRDAQQNKIQEQLPWL
jgi:hypothetical protein